MVLRFPTHSNTANIFGMLDFVDFGGSDIPPAAHIESNKP